MSGAFYQQFAVTIATATVISLILSLTLSPALAALLLKPTDRRGERHAIVRALHRAGAAFNRGCERLSDGYARLPRRRVMRPKRRMVPYAAFHAPRVGRFWGSTVGVLPARS